MVEGLAEGGPQGDGGRREAFAEGHAAGTRGAVDQVGGQVLGEGQAVGVAQLLADGEGWAPGEEGGRLAQRGSPVQLASRLPPS